MRGHQALAARPKPGKFTLFPVVHSGIWLDFWQVGRPDLISSLVALMCGRPRMCVSQPHLPGEHGATLRCQGGAVRASRNLAGRGPMSPNRTSLSTEASSFPCVKLSKRRRGNPHVCPHLPRRRKASSVVPCSRRYYGRVPGRCASHPAHSRRVPERTPYVE